ncbi:hypothetical protein DFQ27_005618 [Actinomortierella ambigua]|uniref:Uncharacterized protein n=1 Tax=Actinomortierella ambigua TaxID=1343610 RepID=A0A9P6QHA9_9FUNG|nr:hypothetical protein DFQ27_005618 [Actinomortierella ambigua]
MALDVQDITKEIRLYLTGFDLKNLVLVNRQWWRAFAPFLWEKLFINQTNEDQDIILRNGQVVQELTIAVHESETKQRIKWLFGTIAKACPNVSVLNLKLHSALQFDASTFEPLNTDDSIPQPLEALQFLHHLLSYFPGTTILHLQLAHPGLPAIVVLAATQLQYLHELGVYGGLKQRAYTLHKNRRCDWNALFWTMVKSPRLRTLRLSWKEGDDDDEPHDSRHTSLKNALEWIDQTQASATTVQTLPSWTQSHHAQALKVPLPVCVLQYESSESEEEEEKAANTKNAVATTSLSLIPPQLRHLRHLHLDAMECPPLEVFKRLLHHCNYLHTFSTNSFVHRHDNAHRQSSTGSIAVTKLRMLLEACSLTLRQLDLSHLPVGELVGHHLAPGEVGHNYAVYNNLHNNIGHRDDIGISQWERWTPTLQTHCCQSFQRLTIYAPAMMRIQEPSYLRWITHLTAGPFDNVPSINRLLAAAMSGGSGGGFPALTNVTLYGHCKYERRPDFVFDEPSNTWIWVLEGEREPVVVLPWSAQSTLRHVDLSRLYMEHSGEIESLYDVIRAMDKLETLAMPMGHLTALENLARSLKRHEEESDEDEHDKEEGKKKANTTASASSSSSSSHIATTPAPAKAPSRVAVKTQLFSRSLTTLRVMHDEGLYRWMPTTVTIQAQKHYATVVFDKMPGVRVMQIDRLLMGCLDRQTSIIASQKNEEEDDVPELGQPKNRTIRYQIVS